MSISLSSDLATPSRPLLERILLDCANRLGAISVLLLAAGLGMAYTAKVPSGGGSKVLTFALIPVLIALVTSLWANAIRRRRNERIFRGVTAFNIVLIAVIVAAMIADQSGYIYELAQSIKQWMERPNFDVLRPSRAR